MPSPLEGVRILDLTNQVPGPYCSMLLADLGAEVIKIEPVSGGDFSRQLPPLFMGINRNKKSLALDLKAKQGREIFFALAKQAEVVLEGFRPGVVHKLGIDYPSINKINSKIIYCSISGYGQDGPYANMPGHDVNYVGISGYFGLSENMKSLSELPEITYADISGSMFAVVSILSSIIMREKTGKGQYIDVSMTDGLFSWLSTSMRQVMQDQNAKADAFPHYGYFQAKDNRFLTLGIIHEEHFWKNLCRVLDIPEAADYSILDRITKREELFNLLCRVFLTKERDEWVRLLLDANVPCGPVHSPGESLADPQLLHRGMVYEMAHPTEGKIKQRGFPVKFSDIQLKKDQPPPSLGQHTKQILSDLGYTSEEIKALEEMNVILT